MKKIFVVCGYSDSSGHDLPSNAVPLSNAEHVFSFDGFTFTPDPSEPVFGGDASGNGSSPIRYMADDLAGSTGDDIAFMQVPHGNWHEGILGFKNAAAEAIAMLQPALDQGWEFAGVIFATGPGDADTWREVHCYQHRFERVAATFGDVPIFNMQTELLTGNRLDHDYQFRVHALRCKMANVDAEIVKSDPHWHAIEQGAPFHVDTAGAVQWGQAIADSVLSFWGI